MIFVDILLPHQFLILYLLCTVFHVYSNSLTTALQTLPDSESKNKNHTVCKSESLRSIEFCYLNNFLHTSSLHPYKYNLRAPVQTRIFD